MNSRTAQSFIVLWTARSIGRLRRSPCVEYNSVGDSARKSSECILEFWPCLVRLVAGFLLCGSACPPAVAYPDSFYACRLSHDHQVLVCGTMEVAGKRDELGELNRLTIKFYANRTHAIDEICHADQRPAGDPDSERRDFRANRRLSN